jgi:hypothetical protein
LEFLIVNKSTVTAKRTEVWVVICDGCTFTTVPDGFDQIAGNNEQTRHRLYGDFNPGVGLPKITAVVKLGQSTYSWFGVGLKYSCDNCGGIHNSGNLMVTITPN